MLLERCGGGEQCVLGLASMMLLIGKVLSYFFARPKTLGLKFGLS